MATNPSLLRRVYGAAALFAVLNVLALLGLGAYGFSTGAVNGEKLRDIGRVLRGEPALAVPAPSKTAVEPARPIDSAKPTLEEESDERLEMAHREAERIRTELEQRLALSNSVLLKLREEREAFRKERETAAARDQAVADLEKQEGFQRQVSLIESLAPKVAVQHLLAMPDPDDAARTLSAMPTGRAKKIVEAAKRGAELEQMKAILRLMRDAVPTAVADLGGDEP